MIGVVDDVEQGGGGLDLAARLESYRKGLHGKSIPLITRTQATFERGLPWERLISDWKASYRIGKQSRLSLLRRLVSCSMTTFRIVFWSLIVSASVISGGFFLHDNTVEFLNSTVQTTLDGSVPLSEV